jgi:hypothetical protein
MTVSVLSEMSHLKLLICWSHSAEWDGTMIMNGKLVTIWKEAIVVNFKCKPGHSLEEQRNVTKISRLEPGTPEYKSKALQFHWSARAINWTGLGRKRAIVTMESYPGVYLEGLKDYEEHRHSRRFDQGSNRLSREEQADSSPLRLARCGFSETFIIVWETQMCKRKHIATERWRQMLNNAYVNIMLICRPRDKVLGRILACKKEEVTEGCRKLHNEKLHNLY